MRSIRGSGLVGLLLAIAIIAILVVIAMYGGFGPRESKRADQLGTTVQGAARADALDIECKSNLEQIRQIIQMNYGEDNPPPASLDELRLSPKMLECPIGHEKYQYDPAAGKVKCPHPGHGKF